MFIIPSLYMYYYNICFSAATVGKVKQDDPLEDFKKIAERNGITVCPPGNINMINGSVIT